MWHTIKRCAVPHMLQRNRFRTPSMDDLLPYYTIFTAVAAIVSLVFYVAYYRSLKTAADAPARPLVAVNEDNPASVKLVA